MGFDYKYIVHNHPSENEGSEMFLKAAFFSTETDLKYGSISA